jgi:hypothetical protein
MSGDSVRAMTAIPLGPTLRPHRQIPEVQDVYQPHDAVSEAEATIEFFLDTDPERIARVMMAWINDVDSGSSANGQR